MQIFIAPSSAGEGPWNGSPLRGSDYRPATRPVPDVFPYRESRRGRSVEPSSENVQHLVDMGFSEEDARRALSAAGNNLEMALHALL